MQLDGKIISKRTGYNVVSVAKCVSTFDEIGYCDVIVAREQVRGAGRGGHAFFSPPGGIYLVMREKGLHINSHTLTPAVGLAVHDSINSVLGIETRLKWVNDVILNGKKVCGILCRAPQRGEYLIGVGINYATDEKSLRDAGLGDIAASLNAEEKLAEEFTVDLIKRIHTATLKPFDHKRYNSLCETVNKTVSFTRDGNTMVGYAEYVETDGTLIVRLGMATVAVDAGEVSIIREA